MREIFFIQDRASREYLGPNGWGDLPEATIYNVDTARLYTEPGCVWVKFCECPL